MRIAVIPARGGSKRLVGKNSREFLGIPIIGRVIRILEESNLFDRIVVSTDSNEIKTLAKSFGGDVPFMRPDKHAGDLAGTSEVIIHAINELGLSSSLQTSICCVYPTSVLMMLSDLSNSCKVFESENWDYVFAAYQPNTSPLRTFRREPAGDLSMLFPNYWNSRSQDLPSYFADAGFFYWATVKEWQLQKPIFNSNSTFVEVPSHRAVDINNEADWILAESIYKGLYTTDSEKLR